MRLNKISDVLRKQGKSALYTSAVLSMLAAPAYAQAAEEAQASAAADDVEVIEVRGMRGTMTRSLNEKKNTAAIVDAIAAADFGDLPGLSLSDVIENVSGAAGHRLKGSQNEISIRGLGSYWGNATFNGRTITNAGPNRAVNFKKFPSDLVDKVVIYKTQQADLVEGGIAGTIEVGSLRAVDYGKSKTSVEYQAAYNDYYTDADNQSEWGHKATFSTVQQFETESMGSMGFSFGYVWDQSANPEEVYTTSSTMGACSFVASDGSALDWNDDGKKCFDTRASSRQDTAVSFGRFDRPSLGPDASPDYLPSGVTAEEHLAGFDQDSIFFMPESSTWRQVKDKDQRRSAVGTFQWVPNDTLDINLDFGSSTLDYTEQRSELVMERAAGLKSQTLLFDDEGRVLYEEGEGKTSLQGEKRTQKDDYDGYGIAIDYMATDNLDLSLDASYNESKRNRIRNVTRLRSDNEVAYSIDSRSKVPALYYGDELTNDDGAQFYFKNVDGELVRNYDYGVRDGEGGGGTGIAAFDPTSYSDFATLTDGSSGADYRWTRNYERRKDDIWAIQTDGTYTFDDNEYLASIKAGVRYSREHLFNVVSSTALNPDGSYVNGTPSSTGYYETTASAMDPDTLARVNSCGGTDRDFDGFFDRENSIGQASEFFTYNAGCFIGAFLAGTDGYDGPDVNGEGYSPSDSFYDIGENPNYEDKDGDEFDVREDITAAFIMANIDTEIAGYPVTGNVGMRYVKTETKSKSYSNGTKVVLKTGEYENSDGELEDFQYYATESTGNQRTYTDGEYTEYLPSMNLTVQLDDEWQFKVAAYRAMSRYPMQNMSAGVTTTVCGDEVPDSPTDSCVALEDQVSAIQETGSMFDAFTSSNYDMSIEWYPSQDMAITLGGYWKDFKGGAETTTSYNQPTLEQVVVDVDGLPAEYPSSVQFSGRGIADDETTIKGFELTWQKHFVELPAPFNGIGIKGAWNHAVSDFETVENANYGISPNANLWGFSPDTANASIYWEGEKLSMRLMYKYRASYFQPTDLFDEKTNRWVDDSEYIDAAVKYKITKGVSVSLKALNLGEESQVQYRGTGTVSEVSQSGRKFFLSVKAQF